MELFRNLFEGYPNLWGGGVAHSVLILSLVIAFGIMLGKIKVAGISLGVTWILFVGIVFGHFNLNLDEHLLHFLKEFGLILFVYSVGLQVGPGFFSAFKKGGFTLNLLAMMVVFLGVTVTVILHFVTGVPITTMVGILSGAVTNTPGLGAAQQANSDLNGIDAPEIALGYAVKVGHIPADVRKRRFLAKNKAATVCPVVQRNGRHRKTAVVVYDIRDGCIHTMKHHLIVHTVAKHIQLHVENLLKLSRSIDMQRRRASEQAEGGNHSRQSETVVTVQM